jgi:hypothetical protein
MVPQIAVERRSIKGGIVDMLLIVLSPHHTSPTPLRVSLGTHTLLIASERDPIDASLETEGTEAAVLLDNEEAYRLCVCLQTLFRAKEGC